MKIYQLDKEEEEILRDYEAGKHTSGKDFAKRRRELILAAQETVKKRKNINIRLSEHDLYQLKIRAVEEGMPYQTLVSSILHKYVTRSATL